MHLVRIELSHELLCTSPALRWLHPDTSPRASVALLHVAWMLHDVCADHAAELLAACFGRDMAILHSCDAAR